MSDSTWPRAPEALWAQIKGLDDHDIDRITHLNAIEQFRYDPFTALGGRDHCTVGALRAKAAGHDVSIRSTRREGAVASGKTLASELAVAGRVTTSS